MAKVQPVLEQISKPLPKKVKVVVKDILNSSKQNKLEKQPTKDILDFSLEEYGRYRVGDKIVRIIFPR